MSLNRLALGARKVATKTLWGMLFPTVLCSPVFAGSDVQQTYSATGMPMLESTSDSGDSDNCDVIPSVAASQKVRSVVDFGAKPDDAGDDTAAIQRALSSLKSGETL